MSSERTCGKCKHYEVAPDSVERLAKLLELGIYLLDHERLIGTTEEEFIANLTNILKRHFGKNYPPNLAKSFWRGIETKTDFILSLIADGNNASFGNDCFNADVCSIQICRYPDKFSPKTTKS